jgi:hypothetical protein
MKNFLITFLILAALILWNCTKEEQSERFTLLTTPTWVTDSLLANGIDAGNTGGLLEKFKGEAKFDADGTGKFGIYTGNWQFSADESQIVIVTDSLKLPLATIIDELTETSLKINTQFPNSLDPLTPIKIRMTFKAK